MAITCTPQALATVANPFQSVADPGALKTYLIARVAGGSIDPWVLASQASCFVCLSGELEQVQLLLLCRAVNLVSATSCAPQDITSNSTGFENLPTWVELYLWALLAQRSMDPAVLEIEARCFSCLEGMFSVVQTMLLCTISASASCDANTLSLASASIRSVPNIYAARLSLLCQLASVRGL